MTSKTCCIRRAIGRALEQAVDQGRPLVGRGIVQERPGLGRRRGSSRRGRARRGAGTRHRWPVRPAAGPAARWPARASIRRSIRSCRARAGASCIRGGGGGCDAGGAAVGFGFGAGRAEEPPDGAFDTGSSGRARGPGMPTSAASTSIPIAQAGVPRRRACPSCRWRPEPRSSVMGRPPRPLDPAHDAPRGCMSVCGSDFKRLLNYPRRPRPATQVPRNV